jgi:predicted membrane-bound mannosyltransferase
MEGGLEYSPIINPVPHRCWLKSNPPDATEIADEPACNGTLATHRIIPPEVRANRMPMMSPFRWFAVIVACLLVGVALWLRWPTFGFSLWNVDEAIHAAAARTILDGGVLYRDAVDQRTPLTYYTVAAIFSVVGENNLWAVRCFVALLIAATGGMLFLAGQALRSTAAGTTAGLLYVLLATSTLYQGDANAANTEWFVAFFSSAAAAFFLRGGSSPRPGRLVATGMLLGGAFLSKQPALLDVAAPMAALIYAGWRQARTIRDLLSALAMVVFGWLVPVTVTVAYFAAQGALGDAVFYTWTYNLSYYGPEVDLAGRMVSAVTPFQLIGGAQPWLLSLWVAGAYVGLHRILQRQPTAAELAGNHGLIYLTIWSIAGVAGAASGGRSFDHYTIQFLAPFCLGAGLVLAHLATWARSGVLRRTSRVLVSAALVFVAYETISTAVSARGRTLPDDPSQRVAAYIRQHSGPDDHIYVWGYHPDIYLYADRLPASRFLYASFLTGLLPWTNTSPERDTAYAIVPGTMETLIAELMERPPVFIVDCSAGPNRHWQKYPLENFPKLQTFIYAKYRLAEAHHFVPQGFRLYKLRSKGDVAPDPVSPSLPTETIAALKLGTIGSPITPAFASARHGANVSTVDGRKEFFAHAPSTLVYRLSPEAAALRGGFGLYAGAFAPDNASPSDGAEFVVRWRPTVGQEQVLLRRLLRPREEPADRGHHDFRVNFPPHTGGELELTMGPGPAGDSTSDWTYWSDLLLENYR